METRLIGSLTEIYIGGGNSWITESFPTNFHTFCKRKVLTAKDSVDNYKEVTDAEKTALEKADAEWRRPPLSFIDEWDVACGVWGTFNNGTGYFELNGLLDITYEQALKIFYAGDIRTKEARGLYEGSPIRTNLPSSTSVANSKGYSHYGVIINDRALAAPTEVLNLCSINGNESQHFYIANDSNMNAYIVFNAKKVLGIVDLCHCNGGGELFCGGNVESIKILGNMPNTGRFAIGYPNIDSDSMRFLVENMKMSTDSGTIHLYPRVYDKIIDESNEEWHSLLELAAEKNITFVT